ncbi:hypothetical protein D3C75_1037550 [compost metagenome]
MHGKRTLRTQGIKLLRRDPLGSFAFGFGRTGDDPAGNFYPGGGQLLTRRVDQGIFPGTRRPNQKYQPARP